jgi:hypothetical protein
MSLVVICPSRARPENAAELIASFEATRGLDDTRLVFAVDVDDPERGRYPEGWVWAVDPPPGCMNAALNAAARDQSVIGDASVVGFVGDDHRFRTSGWDRQITDVLTEHGGIAYVDDLYQRINLPTMWFVSRPIVEVFGMGLPSLRHLWIDDYWKTLGEAADCLYYLPDVVIEHMHPYAGKAPMDAGYERVNSAEMIGHDRYAFEQWRTEQLATDVATLQTLLG